MIENNALVNSASDLWQPTFFDILDDILSLCCFFGTPSIGVDKRYHYGKSEQINVKIEATITTRTKERSQSEYGKYTTFVGRVVKTKFDFSESNFKNGDLVSSIQKCSKGACSITLPAELLFVIPKKSDLGEAAAIVSTYLPAFSILHYGKRDAEERFTTSSLANNNILVLGGDMPQQEAIAKLAFLGGAREVVALNKDMTRIEYKKYHTGSPNIFELQGNRNEELQSLTDSMDLIIDFDYPSTNFELVQSCLKQTGRLICHREKDFRKRYSFFARIRQLFEDANLSRIHHAYIFDFDLLCKKNYDEVLRDLTFLFRLLTMRKIRPCINEYISKSEPTSSRIQNELQNSFISGEVVCELT